MAQPKEPADDLDGLDDDDLADNLPTDVEQDIETSQDEDFGDETQRNQERAAEEGIEGTSRVRRHEREDEESP